MRLKIDIVDVFTDEQFKGNSAAVVITDSWLEGEREFMRGNVVHYLQGYISI